MEALEMTLLFDYYGDLLTERQRACLDLRYNHDLSLGEIAQELGVSRQGVYDNLSRAEALLRHMEENKLSAIAALKPGAGELLCKAMQSLIPQQQIILEVASTNEKAFRLYERLGFIKSSELSCWYRVK